MKVILDSNIIISDFRLNSPDFKVLLEASKVGDIELYIPEIVLDEVQNKFEERLLEVKSKIDKEKSIIKKLIDLELDDDLSEIQIQNSLNEYKKYIETLFKDNNVRKIDYPTISHKNIVRKAIKKLKPFNSGEKGYRDSLIWENVKSLVPIIGTSTGNPGVIFITNNKKDFCERENDLHKELISEIDEADLDVESIKVVNSLNEFSKSIVQLFFLQANSFKDKLKYNEIEDFNFEGFILSSLRKELEDKDISEIEVIPHSYQDATVRCIEQVENIEILDVRKLNSSEYHIDLKCNVEMTIDFYVDKYDYYLEEYPSYDVEDSNWNDYVVWASEMVSPELKISVIIDNEYDLVSIQIH